MIMKMIIEWIKSLLGYKQYKKVEEQPEVACMLQEADTELVTTVKEKVKEVKQKPQVKKTQKKRGRPRKKKKEE